MGSAHFLTAALDMMADRIEIFLAEVGGLPGIAQRLSELSQDNGAVSQQLEDGDLLRRLLLKRCIYGVDLSPMAVEVANVTLWLASFVPRPGPLLPGQQSQVWRRPHWRGRSLRRRRQ